MHFGSRRWQSIHPATARAPVQCLPATELLSTALWYSSTLLLVCTTSTTGQWSVRLLMLHVNGLNVGFNHALLAGACRTYCLIFGATLLPFGFIPNFRKGKSSDRQGLLCVYLSHTLPWSALSVLNRYCLLADWLLQTGHHAVTANLSRAF